MARERERSFECPRCGYKTHRRFCIQQHLDRKEMCIAILEDLSVEEIYQRCPEFKGKQYQDGQKCHECTECHARFTSQSGLSRHKSRYCKSNQKRIEESTNDERLKKLEDQNKQLEDQNKLLNEKLSWLCENQKLSVNNGTINNTNHTTHNTVIQITAFGKEDLQHLLDNKPFMDTCLKRREMGLLDLIRAAYFNRIDYPQNANIKITNYRMPYIDVYDGSRWIKCDKQDILEGILDTGCSTMDEHYEDLKENESLAEKFTKNIVKLVHDFMIKVKDREQHKKFFDDLKQRIHLLIINESKI